MERRTRKCKIGNIENCNFIMWTERMMPVDDYKRYSRMQPVAIVEKPDGQITEVDPVEIQFTDRTLFENKKETKKE